MTGHSCLLVTPGNVDKIRFNNKEVKGNGQLRCHSVQFYGRHTYDLEFIPGKGRHFTPHAAPPAEKEGAEEGGVNCRPLHELISLF